MDRHGMTKTEAIAALGGLAHLAGDDANALRALCLGMKALARAVYHKSRNRASRTARGIAAYRTPQAALDAGLQMPPMGGGAENAAAQDNERGAAPNPADVRAVAADMRKKEAELWQADRPGFGSFAAALMLDGFASRLEQAVGDAPRPAAGSGQGREDRGKTHTKGAHLCLEHLRRDGGEDAAAQDKEVRRG